MSEPQLTLQDWETLYNMAVASQQREKELEAKVAQLEVQLSQTQASIPKTGLLSQNMVTRILTVWCYLFLSQLVLVIGYLVFVIGAQYIYKWPVIIMAIAVIVIGIILLRPTYHSKYSG